MADDLVDLARRAQRLPRLGVLLRLRRRLAAVDLGHGAGHRDAGAGARRQPPERPVADSRSRRARAAPSSSATPTGVRVAAGRGRLVRALQLRPAPVRAERAPAGRERAAHLRRVRARRHGGGRALPGRRRRRRRRASRASTRAPGRSTRGPSWEPGPEASLNYHTLNRDFARNLCKGTSDPAYCDAADHFTQYLKQDPTVDPHRAVPSPATAGKGVQVPLQAVEGRPRRDRRALRRQDVPVHQRAPSRTASATSAGCRRASSDERTYTYTLFARDLAGNTSSAAGRGAREAAPKRKQRR